MVQIGDIMPQDQKFEVPQQLRHLAEENVETNTSTLCSVDGLGRAGYGNMVIGYVRRDCPGFREVQERAVKLANENAEAGFKLAKDVAKAKDLHELIDLQTRYAQSQMKWYAYQTQEFGRLMAKALSEKPSP